MTPVTVTTAMVSDGRFHEDRQGCTEHYVGTAARDDRVIPSGCSNVADV